MKLGYKLAYAAIGRNVCLEIAEIDAHRIAAFLQNTEIYDESELFRDLTDNIQRGDLASLERAGKLWDSWRKMEGAE
jgi:hypothetical protein